MDELRCDELVCDNLATVKITILRGLHEEENGESINYCNQHFIAGAKRFSGKK